MINKKVSEALRRSCRKKYAIEVQFSLKRAIRRKGTFFPVVGGVGTPQTGPLQA
jgi:hypothetical protein